MGNAIEFSICQYKLFVCMFEIGHSTLFDERDTFVTHCNARKFCNLMMQNSCNAQHAAYIKWF